MALWIHPNQVTFAGQTLRPVLSVRLERKAATLLDERGGGEHHLTFVDACGERLEIVVELEPGAWPDGPALGAEGELSFEASLGAADGRRVRVQAAAVLIAANDIANAKTGQRRVLRFLAVSHDGTNDPVTVEEAT
jgi:hypothetical protein